MHTELKAAIYLVWIDGLNGEPIRVTVVDRREEYAQKRAEYFANPFLRSGVTNFGLPRLLCRQGA